MQHQGRASYEVELAAGQFLGFEVLNTAVPMNSRISAVASLSVKLEEAVPR